MMPLAVGYLIKLAVCLIAVYLFYALVLRRLTFYAWNRWYLLGYSVAAFFIPLINIAPVVEEASWRQHVVVQHIPSLEGLAANAASRPDGFWQNVSVWYYVLAAVGIGVLVMGVRFAIRYRALVRMRRSAKLLSDESVRVYEIDRPLIPFSFGNAIYINPRLHNPQELEQIIHHEFIHVKQKHTVDMLFGELLCILSWYNPFAWLIRAAIRQNLEFMADRGVLQNGVDKKQYQYLLLQVTTAHPYTLTNHFNFSSLKKRITMMNCTRSARIQLGRFLFLLPVMVVLLLAFRSSRGINRAKAAGETMPGGNVVSDEAVDFVVDAADTTPKRNAGTYTIAAGNLSKKVTGTDQNASTDTAPKITGTYTYTSGASPKGVTGTYTYAGRADTTPTQMTLTYRNATDTAPTQMTLSYRYATDTTPKKQSGQVRPQTGKQEDTVPANNYLRLRKSGSSGKYTLPDTVLVVIDGEVQATPEKAMGDLPPEQIESINVLKSEHATALYGEKAKGKKGVIEITTRKGQNRKPAKEKGYNIVDNMLKDTATAKKSSAFKIRGGDRALYVVNGKEYSPAEFKKLNIGPESVESVEVLKGDKAEALYGEKARNGVIVIKTY